jgi:deoxyhypusine synthase
MNVNCEVINGLYNLLDAETKSFTDRSVDKIVEVKKKGGKVVVATGSGPNIHEGVTTLIAELMKKGIIDGVTTSSAVIAHEMGGVLDKVKRVDAEKLKGYINLSKTPRGNIFEFTEMTEEQLDTLSKEMILDENLLKRGAEIEGSVIIKAAGNMAYPMGLRTEMLAYEIGAIARTYGMPFESVAGLGADERTMIGTGARKGIPVLVSVPQLVGGGAVGMCIADSIPNTQRCARIAQMLQDADVIIESAVVLTQEIHDGPFETYTGHGIWHHRMGYNTYSLKDKTIIRIDLDENLKKAWELDKKSGTIQSAIDKGLPKTKLLKIPFRMEMSAFSRLENSIPIVGDIGVIWPIMALKVSRALGIDLDFISYPQQSPEGQAMREYIVKEIKPLDKTLMLSKIQSKKFTY